MQNDSFSHNRFHVNCPKMDGLHENDFFIPRAIDKKNEKWYDFVQFGTERTVPVKNKEENEMKKLVCMALALAQLVAMAAVSSAEGAENGYIPAPYAVDAEHQGPKEYLDPVFYENGEGEPTIGVTYVGVLEVDGKYFKDSNNNHKLDVFEDWRLDSKTRAEDLVSKMTVDQKIGVQQTQVLCSPTALTYEDALDENGKVDLSKLMVISEKVLDVAEDDPSRVNNSTAEIISFGSRLGVVRVNNTTGGALYNNATNMTAEYAAVVKNEPNIPFLSIQNPLPVMGEPGTIGMAAAVMGDVAAGGDYSIIEKYADLDRQLWDARGLDRMYGPQIDSITDPRWARNNTCYTDDPDVYSNIVTALVKGYQRSTEGLQPGGIGLIMKHFPGDGASNNGLESHVYSGQYRTYLTEGSMEKYHLRPFQAAVDANVASFMVCYSRPNPINAKQTYRGIDINPELVSSAFNPTILKTLLRDAMGFEGIVNTDCSFMFLAPYGVEDLSYEDRAALAVEAGSDVIAEFWGIPVLYSWFRHAYDEGKITEEALNRATLNNVKSMIDAGNFENPYRDVEKSIEAYNTAYAEGLKLGEELTRKAIVMLKNHDNTLPLKETGKKVFVATFTKEGADDAKKADWEETFKNAGYVIVDDPAEADIAMLDVMPDLTTGSTSYVTMELVDGAQLPELDPATGEKTGEMMEMTTVMDAKDIAKVADAVHANGGIVLGTVTLNAPWILGNLEPYCDALLANFSCNSVYGGVQVTPSQYQMDVLTGAVNPAGKLPITLPACEEVMATVEKEIDGKVYDICVSPNDVPGFDKDQYMSEEVLAQSPSGSYTYQDADGNFYKTWFGLSY